MSNTISVEVNNLSNVILIYDKVKVYRSTSADGTFVEISNSGNRLTLNIQDTLYSFIDSTGTSSHFYKTAYFNSSSNQESQLSNVVGATIITNQLRENMQVVITLSDTIKDINGLALSDGQTFYFTTVYNPLYSSVRKLRLEVGAFINTVDDDVLNLAIFEASLMANEIHWAKTATTDFFKFARREWTTCKAAEILLNNMIGANGLTAKRLDNFEVTYDPKIAMQILDKINTCLARWEREVISGGAAVQKPHFFVKGEFDIDAPHVGRMWEKNIFLPNHPGSNARYRPVRSRRYIGGWKPGGRLF